MKPFSRPKWLLLTFAVILGIHEAMARVGGGESYSGSVSMGDSGGSGSDEVVVFLLELIFRLLFDLCIEYPKIGIPIVIFLILVIVWVRRNEGVFTPSSTSSFVPAQIRGMIARNNVRSFSEREDPAFSAPAFLDFAAKLYCELHTARGQGKLSDYSLFLSPEAARALGTLSAQLRSVEGIALGSIQWNTIETRPKTDEVFLEIILEACYTEKTGTSAEVSFFATERWKFKRALSVKSLSPERLRSLSCPSCGAAPHPSDGICSACRQVINTGKWNWIVQSITSERSQRPPLLTQTVEEKGTDLPTVFDPDFSAEKRKFVEQAKDFEWTEFNRRLSDLFLTLQQAWSERDWRKARPFQTDSLFQSHSYWMEQYRRQRLINELKEVRIHRIEIVKVQTDAYYFAITARIHAGMIDFTRTEEGKIVSGSPRKFRKFSEYWTFIRSRQAPANHKTDPLLCPSCGAALQINQAGQCEYCHARVTSGEFDWVVSLIEQDESYHG